MNSGDSGTDHGAVLSVLGESDRYGHRRSRDGSEELWAAYHRP
ncbi:hypothetical protein [Kitasatospora sp. NA04385]|nr:hypothetical protein [Kitasatospora sp. NA04385]